MAVDFPVPVVPMSLKCFVSSCGGMGMPATVRTRYCPRISRDARRCRPRHLEGARHACGSPTAASTQRSREDAEGEREAGYDDHTAFAGCPLGAAHQPMVSIPFYDVIIGLVAVRGALAIDAHAQPRRITATAPIDPAAALLEPVNARRQVDRARLAMRQLRSPRGARSAQCDWNRRTQDRRKRRSRAVLSCSRHASCPVALEPHACSSAVKPEVLR